MPEYFCEVLGPQMQGISISKGSMKKQEGFSLSPVAIFEPPHCTPHLRIMSYKREQSRELSQCCQFC